MEERDYFSSIYRFLERHISSGSIPDLLQEVQRAVLFAPFLDLMKEYFDYPDRPAKIISEETMINCAQTPVKGMLNTK